MIHNNVEFHNTMDLDPVSVGGLALRRFPADVRRSLSPLGQLVAQESTGCEVRFVTDAENIRVSVSALPCALAPHEVHHLDVVVFRGPFYHSVTRMEPGRMQHLHLTDIGGMMKQAFQALKPTVQNAGYFDHNVWRIYFGRYTALFHEIETYGHPIRPPAAEEKPRSRMLSYGSSITHGACATMNHMCYAQQAARWLRMDALNLGLSGSCRCEPEMATFLANRDDWDVITLELGINMRGEFSKDEFRERTSRLIESILKSHPDKPIVLITIFPNGQSTRNAVKTCDAQTRENEFNDVLRHHAERLQHPNLHLVEGTDMLTDYDGMHRDLIHPGDYGHTQMGVNLARILQERVLS